MAVKQLEAAVRTQPGVSTIDLQGEINNFGEGALTAAYDEAERADPKTIILNFSAVDYINSTGIALIVGLLARARKANRRLAVFGLSEHYMEIFKITRLSEFIEVYPDEASTLKGVGRQV